MNPKEYLIPANVAEKEYEVKKSRFIARAAHASTREEALAFVAKAKHDFPDARHHCWAYLIGHPRQPTTAAMSDDGEPSGTAGKPILNVLQHKDIGDLVLVVIRYFGGIKLGAGGLVRAYGQSAQQVITELPTRVLPYRLTLTVRAGFAFEQPLRHWLDANSGDFLGVEYSEAIDCNVAITEESHPAFQDFIDGNSAKVLKDF